MSLPEHLRGDVPCSRCGSEDFPVWFTDSVFWNRVVRSEPLPWMVERGRPESDGLMCPNCFISLAHERGLAPTGWRLTPEWHWETLGERHLRRGGWWVDPDTLPDSRPEPPPAYEPGAGATP